MATLLLSAGSVLDHFGQKFPQSGPRLSMLQISKERYVRVQLTEIYEMRPEP